MGNHDVKLIFDDDTSNYGGRSVYQRDHGAEKCYHAGGWDHAFRHDARQDVHLHGCSLANHNIRLGA